MLEHDGHESIRRLGLARSRL